MKGNSMAINDTYTARELASLLEMTERAVLYRAKSEGWESRPRAGRGGGREWLVSSMPEATRIKLAAALAAREDPPAEVPVKRISLPAEAVRSAKARGRADAKTQLLCLCRAFIRMSGLPQTRGVEAFATRWNAGEIESDADLISAIPHVSPNTLRNWEAAVKCEGSLRLAGDYGKGRRGKGSIDSQPEVKEIVLAMMGGMSEAAAHIILDKLRAENARRPAEDRLVLPSLRGLQRWMRAWKAEHPALYQFTQSPDLWKSRFMPAFGDFYATVTRLNQLWEYDGTPSDVMLSDGRRYVILGVIEVFTRRVKLRVAERSTAQEVAELTRDCLLDWGVPEAVVTDNGKEFVSRQMVRLFADLDIRHEALPPFRPDLKPAIERVFRNFSHDLLPAAPCYLGHDVATRRKIESRKSFADQLMKRGKAVEISIAMTPEELQAFCNEWACAKYLHRPHEGLHGKTPYQKLCECADTARRIPESYRAALDMLLLPVAGERVIRKDGVSVGGRLYLAAEFGRAEVMGRLAEVRLDRRQPDTAYVYLDGLFLCRALCVDSLSADERRDLAAAGRLAARSVKAEAAQIRRLGKKHGIGNAAREIMEYHLKRAAEIEREQPLPRRAVEAHSSFELEEARRAACGKADMGTLSPEEARRAREEAQACMTETFTVPASSRERYALYQNLTARSQAGETLTPEQSRWLAMYRSSAEFKGQEDMRQLFAVG